MKRFAIIIEASRAKGKNVIDGCKRDAERLEGWFTSNPGGAWNVGEFRVLNNPSLADIEAAMRLADATDFAIVTFSGHGRIIEDAAGRRRQMVTIGTGEEIDFSSLKPAAPKSILSCDACREIHRPSPIRKTMAEATKFARFAETRWTRSDYRRTYEEWIENARGTFTMYSCSPGQCAGDDPLNGGTFTDAMLNVAAGWLDESSQSAVLTVDNTLEAVKPIVARISRQADPTEPQDPSGGPSIRAGSPYPFALRLV